MVFGCQGVNQCAVAYLCFFFVVLVVDIMVLNCFYYLYVRGDPSLAGRFNLNAEQTMDEFLAPIIVTICILIVYYSQFTVAMGMGCARMRDKEIPKARKVTFTAGHVVHFFFIFCVLFGVFSRHFKNGGI